MNITRATEKMTTGQSLAAILCGLLMGILVGAVLFFPAAYIAGLKYDHNEDNLLATLLILALGWGIITLFAASWACATMAKEGQEKKYVAILAILPAAATLAIIFIPGLTPGVKTFCILVLLLPVYPGSLAGYKLAIWQKKNMLNRRFPNQ